MIKFTDHYNHTGNYNNFNEIQKYYSDDKKYMELSSEYFERSQNNEYIDDVNAFKYVLSFDADIEEPIFFDNEIDLLKEYFDDQDLKFEIV